MLRFFSMLFLIFSFGFSDVLIEDGKLQIKTKSGYETYANIIGLDNDSKEQVFVLIHGKGSAPDKTHYENLANELSYNGYTVALAKMPWNKKWNGSFSQGLEVIDEICDYYIKNGKKVILIGHSMGGATSLIYAAKKDKKAIDGIITIAPGHMIHKSKKILKITKKSVERAKKLVEEGDENSIQTFKEQNTGKTGDVDMSAKNYLSYYDTYLFPNVESLLENIDIPVLWIAGDNDRLTQVYGMEDLFGWLGENEKNSYELIDGNHKSVVENSSKTILSWMQNY